MSYYKLDGCCDPHPNKHASNTPTDFVKTKERMLKLYPGDSTEQRDKTLRKQVNFEVISKSHIYSFLDYDILICLLKNRHFGTKINRKLVDCLNETRMGCGRCVPLDVKTCNDIIEYFNEQIRSATVITTVFEEIEKDNNNEF